MARALKEGMVINGYRLTKVFDPGAMAAAAAAVAPSGETVFFKQYKQPSVRSEWYKGYVKYQEELKRRVESSDLKDFTYRFVEFFTFVGNNFSDYLCFWFFIFTIFSWFK